MTIVDELQRDFGSGEKRSPLIDELFPDGFAARAVVEVAQRVGPPLSVCRVHLSSAAVVGFVLADGSRVVVKVHRHLFATRVSAVLRAQRTLTTAGLPVASALLVEPIPCGTGVATIDTWLEAGVTTDVRPEPLRAALAMCTYEVTQALDPFDFPELRQTWTGRFPPPHSPLFDFGATTFGAEWIDELADHALALRTHLDGVGREVAMHADIRPENVLVALHPPKVSSLYDLDAIHVDREPWLLGGVARAFSTNWSLADPMLPTLDEILAFVADYENARGQIFTEPESKLCRAGILHALAYSARCEHALFPDGGNAPWGEGWRGLLRQFAASGLAQ